MSVFWCCPCKTHCVFICYHVVMLHDKATVICGEYSEYTALAACNQGRCLNTKTWNHSDLNNIVDLGYSVKPLYVDCVLILLVYFTHFTDGAVLMQFDAHDCLVYTSFLRGLNLIIQKQRLNI